jgi:ribokinase
MIDCTECSEGRESMTGRRVMIDCTERSEGRESMTGRHSQ